jgi:hypothetical protein
MADAVREHFAISDREVQDLDAGKVIIKVLKGQQGPSVALLAAVRVSVPFEYLMENVRDIERSVEQDEGVVAGGRMVPGETAVDWLTLPDDDLDALSKCRVGKCDFKLPAAAIEAIHDEVDWSGAGSGTVASAFVAGELNDLLDGYVRHGNTALMTYGDKPKPHTAAEALRSLLDQATLLRSQDPAFWEYVQGYPVAAGSGGEEDVFYWSIEDFGLRPTLSLYHMIVDRTRDGPTADALIAVKRIYANHYFQGALELLYVTESTEAPGGPDLYAIILLRAHFDENVGGIKRGLLESNLKGKARSALEQSRRLLEASYRESR